MFLGRAFFRNFYFSDTQVDTDHGRGRLDSLRISPGRISPGDQAAGDVRRPAALGHCQWSSGDWRSEDVHGQLSIGDCHPVDVHGQLSIGDCHPRDVDCQLSSGEGHLADVHRLFTDVHGHSTDVRRHPAVVLIGGCVSLIHREEEMVDARSDPPYLSTTTLFFMEARTPALRFWGIFQEHPQYLAKEFPVFRQQTASSQALQGDRLPRPQG